MAEFIIGYVEDNKLGVYHKQILVEARSFFECIENCKKEYPTVFSVEQVQGVLEQRWRDYFTHESQDQLQRSKGALKVGVQNKL